MTMLAGSPSWALAGSTDRILVLASSIHWPGCIEEMLVGAGGAGGTVTGVESGGGAAAGGAGAGGAPPAAGAAGDEAAGGADAADATPLPEPPPHAATVATMALSSANCA